MKSQTISPLLHKVPFICNHSNSDLFTCKDNILFPRWIDQHDMSVGQQELNQWPPEHQVGPLTLNYKNPIRTWRALCAFSYNLWSFISLNSDLLFCQILQWPGIHLWRKNLNSTDHSQGADLFQPAAKQNLLQHFLLLTVFSSLQRNCWLLS